MTAPEKVDFLKEKALSAEYVWGYLEMNQYQTASYLIITSLITIHRHNLE